MKKNFIGLAVRVRIKITREGIEFEIVALANNCYEAETPQILIPIQLV